MGGIAKIVGSGDARVLDLGQEREFPLDLLEILRVRGLMEELERKLLPQVSISHQEHAAHSASPQLSDDLVTGGEVEMGHGSRRLRLNSPSYSLEKQISS